MGNSRRTFMDDLSLIANFPTGRRDHSRSPPKQAFRDDPQERNSRYRDDERDHDYDYDNRSGRHDDGYSRRGGASREARYNSRDEHDYRGMYDDGYVDNSNDQGQRRHEDDKRSGRGRYRDGDGPRSQSPSVSYHNRGRSGSPTRDAGKPSDTVILEGLPFSISSNELRDSILSNSVAAEFPSIDVRVSASKGNRRAFVQFQEVDHAVAFMREHYPKLLVEMTHSTDDVPEGRFDAYIHYARNRDARDEADARGVPSGDWICPTCDFSNYSTRTKCKICGGPQAAPSWQMSLTGMADASDVPAQILVVYPLASFVTEDMLAEDMKRLELVKPNQTKDTSNGAPKLKSTAPTGDTTGYGARPGSLHRVFLMRDAHTNESFKYGFAEFWTVEDASAAMTKFHKSRSFTVAACPVTVSSTHMGVFLPEQREVTPEIEHLSFTPLFNPNLRVRYRDYHVYPSPQVVNEQPPGGEGASKTTEEDGNDKKSKKRKAEGSLAASSTKKSVPMMAGQMAMWQRKRDELRVEKDARPARQDKAEFSDVNRTPLRINLSGSGGDSSKPQSAIKISLSGTQKLGPPEHAAPSKQGSPDEAGTPSSTTQATSVSGDAPVSYVDRDRLMCLICMRKYKSVDEVNIHEKSRNHKNAMENEEQVKAALPRLAARDKRLQKQAQENPDSAAATSQYRDRAKERRAAFNQPTKPDNEPQSTTTTLDFSRLRAYTNSAKVILKLRNAPATVSQPIMSNLQPPNTVAPTPTPSGNKDPGLRYPSNGKNIYSRPLNRTKTAELSQASFAYLFGEMVTYAQRRVKGIQELEQRLNLQGHSIGLKLLDLLLFREPARTQTRPLSIIALLHFIKQNIWQHLFGRQADRLEKSANPETPDEYMIIDNEPLVNQYISVPKEMSQLNCAAYVAGIVEGVCDGADFPARVTAHTVAEGDMWPGKTVFLVKFRPEVLEREGFLGKN